MSDEKDRQQMAINLLRQGMVMRVKTDYFRVTGNSGLDEEWNVAYGMMKTLSVLVLCIR